MRAALTRAWAAWRFLLAPVAILIAWQALGARGLINVSSMPDPAAFARSASLLRPLPSEIADADATLAIENHGCESANLQPIRDDELVLPTCGSPLPDITRGIVKSIAREGGLGVSERNVSISEFYNADEAFICGTVDEIAGGGD